MAAAGLLLAVFALPAAAAAYLHGELRAERARSARLRETCEAWAALDRASPWHPPGADVAGRT
jgi:hypothetical protein